METKYLIQSKATGDYFVKTIGPVLAWSEFPLLAAKFNFETLAFLAATVDLNLKEPMFRIVPVQFKTDAECGKLVEHTGATFTPNQGKVTKFTNAEMVKAMLGQD